VIARVKAQAARLSDTAALFQALGGGWWHRDDVSPPVQTCCGLLPGLTVAQAPLPVPAGPPDSDETPPPVMAAAETAAPAPAMQLVAPPAVAPPAAVSVAAPVAAAVAQPLASDTDVAQQNSGVIR